jgi:hypothetical protein
MKSGTRGGLPDGQRQADCAHLEHVLPRRSNRYFDIYECGHGGLRRIGASC